jgi:hypothetical protein
LWGEGRGGEKEEEEEEKGNGNPWEKVIRKASDTGCRGPG